MCTIVNTFYLPLYVRPARFVCMRQQKPARMNFKFLPEHRAALENLADKQGLTMTEVVEGLIERSAKRMKCWQKNTRD